MNIQRVDCAEFRVNSDVSVDDLTSRLLSQQQAILFVVSDTNEFIGAITRGDINKAAAHTEKHTEKQTEKPADKHNEPALDAAQICNRSPRTLSAALPDADIAKCFDSRIQCVPLLDDDNKLVAVALPEPKSARLNLNIGAGSSVFDGFINLDIKSDWYAEHHAQAASAEFVEYNILTDILPYASNSVDHIYLSHVIEHLKDEVVSHFLQDCARVLKPGGVMRIACPDAEFLAQISAFENDFWFWRREWFRIHAPDILPTSITQFDYLVREVATEKAGKVRATDFPANCLQAEQWYQTLETLVEGLAFNESTIGNHINFWTFDKLKLAAQFAGFKQIIKSRYQGCLSQDMKGPAFDQTRPEMSLYVDLIGEASPVNAL